MSKVHDEIWKNFCENWLDDALSSFKKGVAKVTYLECPADYAAFNPSARFSGECLSKSVQSKVIDCVDIKTVEQAMIVVSKLEKKVAVMIENCWAIDRCDNPSAVRDILQCIWASNEFGKHLTVITYIPGGIKTLPWPDLHIFHIGEINDIVGDRLRAIGMGQFTDILYPVLSANPDATVEDICNAYPVYGNNTLHSQRARLSKARRIFRDGQEREALERIAMSPRVTQQVSNKAQELLNQSINTNS